MAKVLVTGAGGQLGKCIKAISGDYDSRIKFVYKSSSELDISNTEKVMEDFKSGSYDYCINCAAYTHVDYAESHPHKANAVNVVGAGNLAIAGKSTNTVLIHISTDFVFDGSKTSPYSEEDNTKPLGVYGSSKLLGEQEIVGYMKDYFIIRTSWLYSEFGHNFMKSMIKFGTERESLSVVNDQIGTPTYAKDLAKTILKIIETSNKNYGTYHYSNEGVASWYDFAKAIFEMKKIAVDLRPIPSSEYPLPAQRPGYSVLDKSKIKETLRLEIPQWRDSLAKALHSFEKLGLSGV